MQSEKSRCAIDGPLFFGICHSLLLLHSFRAYLRILSFNSQKYALSSLHSITDAPLFDQFSHKQKLHWTEFGWKIFELRAIHKKHRTIPSIGASNKHRCMSQPGTRYADKYLRATGAAMQKCHCVVCVVHHIVAEMNILYANEWHSSREWDIRTSVSRQPNIAYADALSHTTCDLSSN